MEEQKEVLLCFLRREKLILQGLGATKSSAILSFEGMGTTFKGIVKWFIEKLISFSGNTL